MSCLEVAGVVLGAFPVAVAGVNHFVDGVQSLGYWRRYRLKLSNYANLLETNQTFYLDTLEYLLSDIVQSDEDLRALANQPGGAMWRQPQYDERLRQRLDRSYHACIQRMTALRNLLEDLCCKLGVDMMGNVSVLTLPQSARGSKPLLL